MLPTNLAKTRAAGRTTYGELVVMSGTPTGSIGTVGGPSTSVRFTPYPLPATITNQHQQTTATAHHLIPIGPNPTSSLFQYAQQPLYDASALAAVASYKRLLASNAAAAQLRTHASLHSQPQTISRAATATLSYPITDLLAVQGLEMPTLYPIPSTTLSL